VLACCLATSTAVTHFYNGTVLDIAKIPATPAYKTLIERLGNAPAPKPLCRVVRWQRWWNKKRGLPATANVGVLASLLAALKLATTEALAQPIDHVAVTRPSIPALTQEDLDDALEYAGLRGWLGDSRGFQPKHVVESQAAFTGNGHGLCTSYHDVMECWQEGIACPNHLGLFISLTRHALYASLDKMNEAYPRWVRDGPRVLDFDAGLDSRSKFPSDGDYWAHIRTLIVVLARQGSQPVSMLLLGGENATNSMFLETVRDALAWLTPTLPLNFDVTTVVDPTFAAARGMAMYARRRQEAAGHCVERERCNEEREKQRAIRDERRVEL
jgi:hypothetical protein